MFKFKGRRRASDCLVGNNRKDDNDLQINNVRIRDVQIGDVQVGNAQIGNENPSTVLLSSSLLKIAGLEPKSLKVSSNKDCDLLFFFE